MVGRIVKRSLVARPDPEHVFAELFSHEASCFWLDGGIDAVRGRSAMGAVDASDVVVLDADRGLDRMARMLADEPPVDASAVRGDVGFALGWVCVLGYELGARAAGAPVGVSDAPAGLVLKVDRAVSIDHETGAYTVLAVVDDEDAQARKDVERWMDETSASIIRLAGTSHEPPTRHDRPASGAAEAPRPLARWRHTADEYVGLVERCQEYIGRGDAYQLCLTNEIVVEGEFSPLDVFRRLRRSSPSHHGGFVRAHGRVLLSASPEQFLEVDPSGRVSTSPIKGTRPRDTDPLVDAALAAELRASVKEQAENVMIVDLVRNDLSHVAELGSVVVESLLAVESYPQVHQLVSTVSARLAPGVGFVDLLRSIFPAGSMTGAPKLSAMQILHGLEGGARGLYAGAFGHVGFDGRADLAMTIRSIVLESGTATIGAGGGITALSVPEEEVEETRLKARALLDALGVARA